MRWVLRVWLRGNMIWEADVIMKLRYSFEKNLSSQFFKIRIWSFCSRCHLATNDDIILRKVEPNLCDEHCEFGFQATWFEKLMSSWSYGTRLKRICRANFLKFVSEVCSRCHLASYDDIILRKVEPNLCDEHCEFGFEATWFERLMRWWSYDARLKRFCRAIFLKFGSEVCSRCHLASYDDIIVLRKVKLNLCDEHREFGFEAAWFEKLMIWRSYDTRLKRICRAVFLKFVSEVCSRCHLASYDDIITGISELCTYEPDIAQRCIIA